MAKAKTKSAEEQLKSLIETLVKQDILTKAQLADFLGMTMADFKRHFSV